MGYTHFDKVSAVNGLAVGAKNAEVVVADASGNLYSAGVQVNGSQTLTAAGAASITIPTTKLALVGAGAITLAAPTAAMLGQVKVIEMTVDNGDVTLSLANVTGGSAATTCTWSAINQALVLVGGTNKWYVVAEAGVALT